MTNPTKTITQYFKDKKIKIFELNKSFWFTAREIAKALEINRTSVIRIYNRNKLILQQYVGMVNLTTPQGTMQKTRIFDRTATIWIAIRSNSPKALPFQEWVLNVIDQIITKGYYYEANIGALLKEMQSLEDKIAELDRKLLTFKDSTFKKKKRHEIILDLLRRAPYLTAKEIISRSKIPSSTVYRYLDVLCEHNLVLMQEMPSHGKGRSAKIYFLKNRNDKNE